MSTMQHHVPRMGWRVLMWGGIAAILVLPLVAMQFTDEVRWTPFDFAAAAVLLGVAGILVELAAAKVARPVSRKLVVMAIATVVLIVWAHGAVGIF